MLDYLLLGYLLLKIISVKLKLTKKIKLGKHVFQKKRVSTNKHINIEAR